MKHQLVAMYYTSSAPVHMVLLPIYQLPHSTSLHVLQPHSPVTLHKAAVVSAMPALTRFTTGSWLPSNMNGPEDTFSLHISLSSKLLAGYSEQHAHTSQGASRHLPAAMTSAGQPLLPPHAAQDSTTLLQPAISGGAIRAVALSGVHILLAWQQT